MGNYNLRCFKSKDISEVKDNSIFMANKNAFYCLIWSSNLRMRAEIVDFNFYFQIIEIQNNCFLEVQYKFDHC